MGERKRRPPKDLDRYWSAKDSAKWLRELAERIDGWDAKLLVKVDVKLSYWQAEAPNA